MYLEKIKSALLLPSARAESKYTDGGNRPRD